MTKNIVTIEGKSVVAEFDGANSSDSQELINFFRKDELIQSSKLAKYYLNENLNFLCGSGTSVGIGGKTINKNENPFQSLIEELNAISDKKSFHSQIITYLESNDLLEKKFDKINQEYLYYRNNIGDENSAKEIKEILDKALKQFINLYIPFPVEYVKDKLSIHELFINKIISRKETLNRPRIFTPNYDLAFENACERIGASYNNGFRGVHMRKFDPDTFHNETYIKQDTGEKGKRIATYLNIYKLHGSISWEYSENIDDLYNIKELQISDVSKKEDLKFGSLMIYPIQTKKSYSLDLPYSELFRNFAKCLTETQNTLVVIGYSFLDEHVNDIIRTGLYNPNLSLIVHSYGLIDEQSAPFLISLKSRSINDSRIIIYEGPQLGDFVNIVKFIIPLTSSISDKTAIIETLKELLKK